MSADHYGPAVEAVAGRLEGLLAEQFQRGADSLGPDGWGILAGALHAIAEAIEAAAERCQAVQNQSDRDRKPAAGSIEAPF